MSDSLDNREKALEKKYVTEEELRFKLDCRAVRLLSLWAAQQFGYKTSAAIKYANKVLNVYVEGKGLPDVIAFIKEGFISKGLITNSKSLEKLFEIYQLRIRNRVVNVKK